MQLHPTFYAGRHKRYHPALLPSLCATPRKHIAAPYEMAASVDPEDEDHAAPHCHHEEPRSTIPNARDAVPAQLLTPKQSRLSSHHSQLCS
uniref:Uncharacterized protein n=1 Tax=Hyaloperonospora arabidopsidis (strain Emoy2) TaxID=559515 RepID=M4BXE4_HYAAE